MRMSISILGAIFVLLVSACSETSHDCQKILNEQKRLLDIECDTEKEVLCDELDKQESKIFMYGVDAALKEVVFDSVSKVVHQRIMEKCVSKEETWRLK